MGPGLLDEVRDLFYDGDKIAAAESLQIPGSCEERQELKPQQAAMGDDKRQENRESAQEAFPLTIPGDRYRILRRIGRGGTSEVWLAEVVCAAPNHSRGLLAALKVPRNRSGEEILRREASLLSSLHHPGIPAFLELLEAEGTVMMNNSDAPDGGEGNWALCSVGDSAGSGTAQSGEKRILSILCLVMEYIEGKSLREILAEQGVLSLQQTIALGEEICEILEYLHGQNPPVLYRDLKPANLIRRENGTVALLDLGSAVSSGMGTAGYAAPELYDGEESSADRCDMYSLGAILHECLTGLSPTQSGLRPLGEWKFVFAGSRIEEILQCCCSVSPSMRYQDVGILRKELAAAEKERRDWFFPPAYLKASARSAWGIFARCLCAVFVCTMGALFFSSAGAGMKTYVYVRFLQEADAAGTLEEKTKCYTEAVRLCPADAEAYERFVNELAADGDFSDQEQRALDSVLQAEPAEERGTQTCVEVLRERAPGDYERLLMLIGRRYFACRQYGERMIFYLRRAADGSVLSARERRSAELLADLTEIGVYGIRVESSRGETSEEKALQEDALQENLSQENLLQEEIAAEKTAVSARTAWQIMKESGEEAERIADNKGEAMTAAAVYRNLGMILIFHGRSLREAGVQQREMEEVLTAGKALLERMSREQKLIPAQILSEAQEALEEADRVVEGL